MYTPKGGEQFSFLRCIGCQYLCSKIIIAEKNNETAGKINQIARGQPEIKIAKDVLVGNVVEELVKIHQHKKHNGGRNKAVPHRIKQLVVLHHDILYQQVKNNKAAKQGDCPGFYPRMKKPAEVIAKKNNGKKGVYIIQPDVSIGGMFYHDAGGQHHREG